MKAVGTGVGPSGPAGSVGLLEVYCWSTAAVLSPPAAGAVVIAFVVCWLPYHARRLMFCYVSDWSE